MKIRAPSILRTLYWRFRQRNIRVRGWTDLVDREDVRGASFAIVGNAGYLRDARLGRIIDSHDLVLRMNNFRVEGFEAAVGSRLDVFMTNFASHIGNLDSPAIHQAKYIVSSRPNNFRKYRRRAIDDVLGRNITAGMCRIKRKLVYAPPLDYFCERTRQIGTYPTTGAMAILLAMDLLSPHCGPIYIAGFSFFEGASHYFSQAHVNAMKDHNLASEKELLRAKLSEPVRSGRVQLDPVMLKHLWSIPEDSQRAA